MNGRRLVHIMAWTLALLVSVLPFQNCSDDLLPSNAPISMSLAGGGDGEPFQGKLTHTRYIPGFTCNGQMSAHSGFSVSGDAFDFVSVDPINCSGTTMRLTAGDVYRPHFAENYLGYMGGVYSPDKRERAKAGIFTEALCQVVTDKGEYLSDLVVEWNQIKRSASLSIFAGAVTSEQMAIPIQRNLGYGFVEYKTAPSQERMVINIKHLVSDGSNHKMRVGAFSGYLNGQMIAVAQVKCLMGGEFDSDIPKIAYQPDQKIFVLNKRESLIPTVEPSIRKFTVSPELPKGLAINANTGEIFGAASSVSPISNYVVEGMLDYGYTSKVVEIGAGKEYQVNSSSDLSDAVVGDSVCAAVDGLCTLRAAIEEVMGDRNSPAVVRLGVENISLKGVPLIVSGQIQIVGKATVVDADLKSRHLNLIGGRVILESLIFENGRHSEAGGSILAESSAITLDSVSFRYNATTTGNAPGGAISARNSQLYIHNSVFEGNQTSLGLSAGGMGFGGAIYFYRSDPLVINDSQFIGNISPLADGGAIYSSDQANITIHNSLFKGNKAPSGGALKLNNWPWGTKGIVVSDSQFINNEASFHGGAVVIEDAQFLTVKNNRFVGNSAAYSEAAKFEKIVSLGIFSNLFEGNHKKYFNDKSNVLGLRLNWFTQLGGNEFRDNPNSFDCRITEWSDIDNFVQFPSPSPVGFFDLGGNLLSDESCILEQAK